MNYVIVELPVHIQLEFYTFFRVSGVVAVRPEEISGASQLVISNNIVFDLSTYG